MSEMVLGKGIKSFLHEYKFSVPYGISIIKARVEASNISTKMLSNRQIQVFGDYHIYISYRRDFNHEKENEIIPKLFLSEKKSFSEIIPYEEDGMQRDLQNVEIKVHFVSEPDCKTKVTSKNYFNAFLDVDVFGEMMVELVSHETVKDDVEEPVFTNKSKTKEKLCSCNEIKELKKKEEKKETKTSTNSYKAAPVKASFYMKENNQFVRIGGSSEAKITHQKEGKTLSAHKKSIKKNEVPIKSWMVEIKEDLSADEILKMDPADFNKTDNQEKNKPISEGINEVSEDIKEAQEKIEKEVEEIKAVEKEENKEMTPSEEVKKTVVQNRRLFI